MSFAPVLNMAGRRQGGAHHMRQRADEVVLAHQHGAAAAVQDGDRAAQAGPAGIGVRRDSTAGNRA